MAVARSAEELQERIGYRFGDGELLVRALTHSSFANEQKIGRLGNYERIEFLGDAVLEMVSSAYLYRKHPQMPEGELTKTRAQMVCEPSLAFCAREFELEAYIRLGRGEDATGGREKDSIVSDVCEALIGAIYLDGGIEPAKDFIDRFVLTVIEDKALFVDSKSALQELVQATSHAAIRYEDRELPGTPGVRAFACALYLGEEHFADGEGTSKKAAEQAAAREALRILKGKQAQCS